MSAQHQSAQKLGIKKHIQYMFIAAFLAFIFNKMYLRPWVVQHLDIEFFSVIVFSLPNFAEAVMGTLIVVGLLFQLRLRFSHKLHAIRASYIYAAATTLAGIYVISQELKFHNLGGNNIYDPYDVAASALGLMFCYFMLITFGFAESPGTEVAN